ncbi:MAG: transcriptional regulator NrdR [candidate division KSB1 bacterium]|nr:transcriptional regulator NrdR [candidate division KSB1 bacterium]MDQ7063747.1 transcriptional regulator NrdR [candidate division KSB1 bacterium]
MKCPYCGYNDTKVLDSRSVNEGRSIRRRRECLSCGRRFTTKEYVEESPLMVIKRDGRREIFDREKVRHGIQLACNKRPISTEMIENLVDRIESQLRDEHPMEVPAQDIGERVMQALRDLDEIAYVRFASVYRKFQDIEEFIHELRELDRRSESEGL